MVKGFPGIPLFLIICSKVEYALIWLNFTTIGTCFVTPTFKMQMIIVLFFFFTLQQHQNQSTWFSFHWLEERKRIQIRRVNRVCARTIPEKKFYTMQNFILCQCKNNNKHIKIAMYSYKFTDFLNLSCEDTVKMFATIIREWKQ